MNRSLKSVSAASLLATAFAVTAFAHNGEDHSATTKPSGNAAVPQPETVTFQGELVDSACYVASKGEEKGAEHAACARKCIGSGIPAGLLPEGSKDANAMRFLLANPTVLAKYAAQTIKVEGIENPAMHAIDVKKVFVKEGNDWKEVQLQDAHHKVKGERSTEKKDDHAAQGHQGHH